MRRLIVFAMGCLVLSCAVASAGAAPLHDAAPDPGTVEYDGAWLTPEEVAARVLADPKLIRYRERRSKCADTAEDHFKLANWCGQCGLAAERRAHLLVAQRLGPLAPRVQQALGRSLRHFPPHGDLPRWAWRPLSTGVWMTDQEYEQFHQRARQMRDWKGTLLRWRRDLISSDPERASAARKRLNELSDPLAIPALEEMLSRFHEELAAESVALLSRWKHPWAVDSLVRHAVFSEWSSIRRAAVEALTQRDPDYYMPQLIGNLVPIRSAEVGFSGNTRRLTRVEVVDSTRHAGRAREALRWLTERDFGAEPNDWAQWWAEENDLFWDRYGKGYPRFRTVAPHVSIYHSFGFAMGFGFGWGEGGITNFQLRYRRFCLAQKTPVWTRRGPVPIDQVQLGDLVLSLNPADGKLTYQPVIFRTVRPRMALVSVNAGCESIDATPSHRFGVAGRGWVKVEDIEAGAHLQTYKAVLPVAGIGEGGEHVAYDFEVAEYGAYFVGDNKILVHDGTTQVHSSDVEPVLPAQAERSGTDDR